jgi:hypothetical protein
MTRSKYIKTKKYSKKLKRTTTYRRKSKKNNRKHNRVRKYTRKINKYKKYKYIKKQFGGKFNDEQNNQIRNILTRKYNFTEEQIATVINELSLTSQQFSDEDGFEQMINHLNGFDENSVDTFYEMMNWVKSVTQAFIDKVETDKEEDEDEDEEI